MADCAAKKPAARGLSTVNCQAYCTKHWSSGGGSVPPISRDFARTLYYFYITQESRDCAAFDGNRLGLPEGTSSEWIHSHGAELQPCIEHTKSTCKASQEQAETTCVYEQGIFYGVDGLLDCVTSDKTCEAAAQCRRDRAREAGWVEEDKPWWGDPP